MPAIDDAPGKAPVLFRMLVEMHPCGVLVEFGCHHVLGVLDGQPVDMVDLFARFEIFPQMGRARAGRVVAL